MSSMTRTFSKALFSVVVCSSVLAACLDIAGEDISLKVDRSNTLDLALARSEPAPSLEGLWNTLWPKLELSRDATGRYTGRLMEPNVRCGYERGEEVLRGHLDDDGVFSGEVLVCAASQCPGVAARWIYFMALVDRDGSRFVGAIAPTSHEGCNALFRGMPLSGLRSKGASPGIHLAAPVVDAPRAGELDARVSDERGTDACAVVEQQGHLRMTGAGARDVEIAIDGVSWGRPPFLRPIAAGAHRVSIQRGTEAAIVRTICVPGGKEPVSIDVNAILRQAEPPSAGRRESENAAAKPCKRGNKKGLLKITLPASPKATLTIDGKAQNTRGKKIVTRELLAGEHTVVLSRPGVPKETRTVCVHEGRTPVHVNFSAP